jgi:hypothetical protein
MCLRDTKIRAYGAQPKTSPHVGLSSISLPSIKLECNGPACFCGIQKCYKRSEMYLRVRLHHAGARAYVARWLTGPYFGAACWAGPLEKLNAGPAHVSYLSLSYCSCDMSDSQVPVYYTPLCVLYPPKTIEDSQHVLQHRKPGS